MKFLSFRNCQKVIEVYDTKDLDHFTAICIDKEPDVFIMCYGCDNEESLQNIKNIWLPEVKKQIKTHNICFPAIVVGTKSDLIDKSTESIAKEKARKYYVNKELGLDVYVTCSASDCSFTTTDFPEDKGNVLHVFNSAIKKGLQAFGYLERKDTKAMCTIF